MFVDTNSFIDNNGIDVSDTAIEIVGTTDGNGPEITDNVLRNFGIGIKKTGTAKVVIKRNLLIDRDTGYSGGDCLDVVETGSTVDENICDCLDQCLIEPVFASPWF